MDCSMLGFPMPRHLPEFAQSSSVMPLNQWCHPTISSSVPSSSALSLYQHQGLFQCTSGSQSIGASASSSVLSKSIQGWFPLKLTGLISLFSKGLSRVFSSTTDKKHQFFGSLPSLSSSSRIHTWLLEKTALTTQTFVSKVMSLLFNTLHSFPTKQQLSSHFMAAVTICSDFRAQ